MLRNITGALLLIGVRFISRKNRNAFFSSKFSKKLSNKKDFDIQSNSVDIQDSQPKINSPSLSQTASDKKFEDSPVQEIRQSCTAKSIEAVKRRKNL